MSGSENKAYGDLGTHLAFPAMDQEILDLWAGEKTFEASQSAREHGKPWVFFEGPPTANGSPGVHHMEARTFKDAFCRYQTMKGYKVERQGGWDCHGLPVELAVEKELGFTSKADIEAYGVAEFNAKCREHVLKHAGEFEAMTERMGYWLDTDRAYWTMDPDYIQSVWWSVKNIHDQGLLTEDHRVSNWCPRCETGLSEHEVSQGYKDVTIIDARVLLPLDPSFPLASKWEGLALVAWTTTPWTLMLNTAIAASPSTNYSVVRHKEKLLLVASDLLGEVFGEDYEVLETVKGTALEGAGYSRPFPQVEMPGAHKVILADWVSTTTGTGLVHLAPAYGAEDLEACKAAGLPVINPLLPNGTWPETLGLVGGLDTAASSEKILQDLESRGLLFSSMPYSHSQATCWRCDSYLIGYALLSWYLKTTKVAGVMQEQNQETAWHPSGVRDGRYGDWLANNKDWAVSRNRYWGTPLPLWRCEDGHVTAIGSMEELGEKSGQDTSDLDPHRPFVDEVTFPCAHCSQTATRVPEVMDTWYDSGAMPFASHGYPRNPQNSYSARAKADLICEGIDQTRGWFYTLQAVGTLLDREVPYSRVLCLGHILDADGRKMAKRLGNVVDPMAAMEEYGADAVRWFMLTAGSPWDGRRFSTEALEQSRKTLNTYWSTAAFLALYANASDWTPASAAPTVEDRPDLDRWLLSKASSLAAEVDKALGEYDPAGAGTLITKFIDDLSNWYVRLSRRRFWDGDASALATLDTALSTLTMCLAPLAPFVSEKVWQETARRISPASSSVHLETWPDLGALLIDKRLEEQMEAVREVVEAGRAARAASLVPARQPLQKAVVSAAVWNELPEQLKTLVEAELNIHEFLPAGDEEVSSVTVKPNFKSLGGKWGSQVQAVAGVIRASDPVWLLRQVEDGSLLPVPGVGDVSLSSEDLLVTQSAKDGWVSASAGQTLVALDTTMTPALEREGLARLLVRNLQNARKEAGLSVSDRISVAWSSSDPQLVATFEEHGEYIAKEVLATKITKGAAPSGAFNVNMGLPLDISVTQAISVTTPAPLPTKRKAAGPPALA